MELKDRIHLERTRRALTQRELAKAVGVGHRVVSEWERGERRPPLAKLAILCAALNVPLSEFTGSEAQGQDVRPPSRPPS